MPEVDPITAEVIRCGLHTIANEMGDTMIRTATTPTFSESHDFSTSIFDARGRIIALADALPIHMGASKFSVTASLEAFGDDLHPGDIIVVNDPYHGGSHLPDWTMMTPIFSGGELLFFPVTRAHQGDTGGTVPGGYNPGATDIWQEGLRLPPIKICDRGRPRDDIIKMLQINNREPTFLGDLKAMMGSVRVGERRLREMLEKYGLETIGPDDLLVLDCGNNRMFMANLFQSKSPGQVIGPGGAAGVGWGVPAALAAQLICPDRRVVGVCGDGGMMMLYTLEMAKQYEVPINYVVMNNACLGNVLDYQAPGRAIATEYPEPDFAAIARSIGCVGIKVEQPSDLKSALEDATKSERPAVVDVSTSKKQHFVLMSP